MDALRTRLGDVGLVICLDSGAGNYDQLWMTTSLRGMASGVLKVEILTEGIHSGDASGLVPSSFRIMRQVLDRLEDSATGRLLPESFHCEVPAERLAQAQATAAVLGEELYKRFPWAHHDCGGSSVFALPTTTDPVEALLNRTWRPTLSVTGAEGFPTLQNAGNVLRPYTAFKLSLRLPTAGGRGRGRGPAQDPARRQRALPGPGHVRGQELGHRLERPRHHAVVRGRVAERVDGALWRGLRHHRPGRHDPAHEHAQPGFPAGADDGLRRARPQEQRPRPQRIPAPRLRAPPNGQRGPGHRADALNTMADDTTEAPFTLRDGLNVALYDWPMPSRQRPRGVVLIVHGLGEHAWRYDTLAQRMNQWGFAVRAYDQRGHGDSGGARGVLPSDDALLDDLYEVLEDTRKHIAQPWSCPLILFGHSMGGLVAASWVLRGFTPVDGLVLSSPAFDAGIGAVQKKRLIALLHRWAPNLTLSNGLDARQISHDPKVVADYQKDRLVHNRISARLANFIDVSGPHVVAGAPNWSVPTLLLYAGADRLVRPEGSRAFASVAPRSVVTSRCLDWQFHEIFNEANPSLAYNALNVWLDAQVSR